MIKRIVESMFTKAADTFGALRRDRSGVSAIEFVLIFPILVGLLAGTVDFGQALTVSRKMNQVVSTVGDMIAQKSTWTKSDVDAILAGSASIVQPYDTANIKITLVVIDVSNTKVATVNWSQAYQTGALSKGAASPVTIPPDIAQPGVQIVAVKATYSLTTPFSTLLKPVTGVTSYSYTKTYIMHPRVKAAITVS